MLVAEIESTEIGAQQERINQAPVLEGARFAKAHWVRTSREDQRVDVVDPEFTDTTSTEMSTQDS